MVPRPPAAFSFLSRFVVLAAVAAAVTNALPAGSAFVLLSPNSPRYVDISARVRENCSESRERTLGDGCVLRVLYAPGLEDCVEDTFERMERVHDALVSELGIPFKTPGRLYLVQLGSYPPSFKIFDKARGTAAWALIRSVATSDEKALVIEREVYGTFPHEWTHAILDERFGAKARLWRSRWITEGLAAYTELVIKPKLSQDSCDEDRRQYLPYFNLEKTSLSMMLAWRYPWKVPNKNSLKDLGYYGAAGGLLLRVREAAGADGVFSLLDLLKDDRKIRAEDLQAALMTVTGRSYEELARISPEERESFFREALAALDGPARSRRLYGLAVLGRYPDRADEYRQKVESLSKDPAVDEGVRKVAGDLLGSP